MTNFDRLLSLFATSWRVANDMETKYTWRAVRDEIDGIQTALIAFDADDELRDDWQTLWAVAHERVHMASKNTY